MKNNELRIGNHINYATSEGDITSIKIIHDHIRWCFEDTKGFNMVHKPILLNKESLSVLCSEESYSTLYIPLPNIKAELHFEIHSKQIVTILYSDSCKLILDPLKYVHQLQNLYYVLSNGLELEFKNK